MATLSTAEANIANDIVVGLLFFWQGARRKSGLELARPHVLVRRTSQKLPSAALQAQAWACIQQRDKFFIQ
jgi:hypothetical protein